MESGKDMSAGENGHWVSMTCTETERDRERWSQRPERGTQRDTHRDSQTDRRGQEVLKYSSEIRGRFESKLSFYMCSKV